MISPLSQHLDSRSLLRKVEGLLFRCSGTGQYIAGFEEPREDISKHLIRWLGVGTSAFRQCFYLLWVLFSDTTALGKVNGSKSLPV